MLISRVPYAHIQGPIYRVPCTVPDGPMYSARWTHVQCQMDPYTVPNRVNTVPNRVKTVPNRVNSSYSEMYTKVYTAVCSQFWSFWDR